jgi:hypothetical protein
MNAPELPPLVKRLHLRLPVAEAFAIFTREIGRWWPLGSHSCSLDRAARLELDGRVGGTINEHAPDGRVHCWGTLVVWEPPHRFAMTWHPGRDATEATHVEVRFEEEGDGCTMQLIHAGWEARGAAAMRAREQYDQGWVKVLGEFERFGAAARS